MKLPRKLLATILTGFLSLSSITVTSGVFSTRALAYENTSEPAVVHLFYNRISQNDPYISIPDTFDNPSCFPMEYNNPNMESWLRTNLPPLRNQGIFGTCSMFQQCAMAECYMKRVYNKDIDLSEYWGMMQYFTDNRSSIEKMMGTNSSKIDTGSIYDQYLYIEESALPYPETEEEVIAQKSLPDPDDYYGVRCTDYAIINNNNTEVIKYCINQYGSCGVNITFDTQCYNASTNSCFITGSDGSREKYGHAFVIVGWDDNYPKENFDHSNLIKNNGAWLARNTGGENNGFFNINSYFWLSYESRVDSYTTATYKERIPHEEKQEIIVTYDTPVKIKYNGKSKKLNIRTTYQRNVFSKTANKKGNELLKDIVKKTDLSEVNKAFNAKKDDLITAKFIIENKKEFTYDNEALSDLGKKGFYIQLELDMDAAKKAKLDSDTISSIQKSLKKANKSLKKNLLTYNTF